VSRLPIEWTRAMVHLRAAQVARDTRRNPAATQIARDQATIEYTRATDALVEDLGLLSERLVLGRITQFLQRGDR
jgi:hypothetical protein